MKILAFSIFCLFFLASSFSAKSICSCIHNGKPCDYSGFGEPKEGDNVICSNAEEPCFNTCLNWVEKTLKLDVSKKEGITSFSDCIKPCSITWNSSCTDWCKTNHRKGNLTFPECLGTCSKGWKQACADTTLTSIKAKDSLIESLKKCDNWSDIDTSSPCAHGCRDIEKAYKTSSENDLLICYKNCNKWDNGKHHNKCLDDLRSKNGTLATYNNCVTNS